VTDAGISIGGAEAADGHGQAVTEQQVTTEGWAGAQAAARQGLVATGLAGAEKWASATQRLAGARKASATAYLGLAVAAGALMGQEA
jgi:hypothetical protein